MLVLFFLITDCNHKLIRWRIVIQGGIYGFMADTVFQLYERLLIAMASPWELGMIKEWKILKWVDFMFVACGLNWRSIIIASSVHFQIYRIEQLWRDFFPSVTQFHYRLFYYMEDIGILGSSGLVRNYGKFLMFL